MDYETLYSEIIQGHTETVFETIDEVDLTPPPEFDKHFMSAAVWGGDREVVHKLLDRGVDPNGGVERGTTPLHTAIREGKPEIARTLVEGGADLTIEDQHGKRPLHMAVANSEYEMTKLLLDHGGDPTHEDEFGHSPVWLLGQYRDPADGTSARDRFFDLMTEEQLATEASCEPDPSGLAAGHTHVDCSGDVREWVWEHLVPPRGQADTVQGELLRAVEKLRDEGCRNGYANWDKYHERLADYLETHLCDEELFDTEAVAQTRADISRVRDQYVPRVNADPSIFDRLISQVVTYCEKRPELIEEPHNDDLEI